MLVDLFDVDRREVAEVIAIDEDEVDDVVVIDPGVDDVAFADEHLEDVAGFDFLSEGVEAIDGPFEVGGTSNLREEDDGDIEVLGKFCEVIDDLLDAL